MNLKKETILSPGIILSVLKGFLVPIFLLFAVMAHAQVISVVETDASGGEVTAPGSPDPISFTISRTNELAPGTIVNYTITGTATPGQDFASPLATGSVTLSFVDPSQVVAVSGIDDDDLVEGEETVTITLTGVEGSGTIDPALNSATAIITDNDFGTITVSATDANAEEATPANQTGAFTIDLGAVNNTGLFVNVGYTIGGSATAGVDHTTTSGTVLINDGDRTAVLTIVPDDDTEVEMDEDVTITLNFSSSPSFAIGAAPTNTATVTIEDNDCAAGTTAPPVNSATATERCDEASVDLDTFVTVAGQTAPAGSTLRWSLFATPTAAQLLPSADATISDIYYGVYWDAVNLCASPAIMVELILNTSPTAGNDANGAACNNPTAVFGPTTLDLDTLLSAGVDPGSWVFTSGPATVNPGVSNVVQFSGLAAGTYTYTYTTSGALTPCTNDSATFTIAVADCDPCEAGNIPPALSPTAPPTDYCRDVSNNEIITLDLDDFTNTSAPSGTELRWSTLSDVENENAHLTSSTINISSDATYFGFFWDDVNNCASPALPVPIQIKSIPILTVGADPERCGPGTVTLTASAVVGTNNATINWYTSLNGGSVAGTGQNFSPNVSQTRTYYVEATFNGCTTSPRVPVEATVVQQPSAGTPQNGGNASACSVEENGPTIVDLDDLLVGEDAGSWVLTTAPTGESVTVSSNNSIDFENRSDGNYVFTYTTTGAQAPCMNESAVITISVNDCDVDTDLDGIFDGPEAVLGTNPNEPDSDGDGIDDLEEVGSDIENPLDVDEDGIIDALDSNILDSDMDGVVDQIDPANQNPCIPNTLNGVCDSDQDGVTDSDETTNGSDPLDSCDPDPDNEFCDPDPIDLQVLKEVDNISALLGETVVFKVTVNNLSDRKAINVIVGDLLESGFEYVSHSPATEQYNLEDGMWQIPLIEAMGSVELEITVTILEGGTYTNMAELLDSFPMDDTPDNNSATVTLPIELPEGIDLILEKTALSANPLVGDEVIFTIKVTNASIDEAPVNNIEVSDLIAADSGFVYVDSNPGIGSTYDEVTGIWAIESLPKGQEIMLEIRVSVPEEGTFTNTAEIRRSSPADGNPDNNEASVEVKVSVPTPADVGFLFNQFSPNGDGTNDVLKINIIDKETNQEVQLIYNIQIFNRYGNLVFEGNNKTDSEVWDGTWKGKEAPDGTYFYTMSLDIGEGAQQKKGWIQLIR